MSIIEPKIDQLLDQADNDRFLLCAEAAKRANDINDMMKGQRERANEAYALDVAKMSAKKPLSIAFEEIAEGDVSYNPDSIDAKNH